MAAPSGGVLCVRVRASLSLQVSLDIFGCLAHCSTRVCLQAAILQQTTEYIRAVDGDKKRLQSQTEHLKRIISDLSREQRSSPPPKRKKRDTGTSEREFSTLVSCFRICR